MATLRDIDKILQQRLEKGLGTLMPVIVNEAVNWTKQNFIRQGWPGASFEPWKARAPNAKRNNGRGILIDTDRRLSRSPRAISVGKLSGSFGTDVTYAEVHNKGFDGIVTVQNYRRRKFSKVRVSTGKSDKPFANKKMATGSVEVRSHTRHMRIPRRQFIGNSPVLVSILRKKAVIHLTKELKK